MIDFSHMWHLGPGGRTRVKEASWEVEGKRIVGGERVIRGENDPNPLSVGTTVSELTH